MAISIMIMYCKLPLGHYTNIARKVYCECLFCFCFVKVTVDQSWGHLSIPSANLWMFSLYMSAIASLALIALLKSADTTKMLSLLIPLCSC